MSHPLDPREVVLRFNREALQGLDRAAFDDLIHPEFVNHSAPPGVPSKEGVWNTFANILHRAFTDLQVVVHLQVAEGDLVTTRKSIVGTHTGPLQDIPPTGRRVEIQVIDIVRIQDGRYREHWGLNDFPQMAAKLREPVEPSL